MTVMRSATLGFALALGASAAQTQTVAQTVSRSTTVVDESVGAAPTTTRTTTRQVAHHTRRATRERTVTHTVRTTRRVATARPLELAPTQRQVIYRTLVQEQVVPQVVVARPAPVVPGYPPFPAPGYPTRAVVVAPNATTGYALPAPAESVDDDLYAEEAAPAPVYAAPAPVHSVGAVLPAGVAVTPLPARATVAVPAVDRYGYATVDNRVLLVDPVSNTVVADITP